MPRLPSLTDTSKRTVHRTVSALSLLLVLSACGYKGPLTQPPPPPAPDASLTTPPATGQSDLP